MIRPMAYEGSEPFIFVSYAHKDSDRVLPIVSALQEQGFRVWYDAGIEAGSEWPEYIAEHLERCTVFLAFLSPSSLDSINCRQEINFAIEERKEMLVVYLEELRLTAGMRMRLGVLQALYRHRHSSQESFLEELCRSRVLASCLDSTVPPSMSDPLPEPVTESLPESTEKEPNPEERIPEEPMPILRTPDLDAIAALFEYRKNKDGGIEITRLKDTASVTLEIPWGVTGIGNNAFKECWNVTSVTIPDTVTTIGAFAFKACSSLTGIVIPNSVTNIGNWAFQDCSSLTDIMLSDSITSLGCSVFSGCSNLRRIHIPAGVTSIGDAAFRDCSGLTCVTLPDSIIRIDTRAFHSCVSLTDITLPAGLRILEGHTFIGCRSLTGISIPEGVTRIGAAAFMGCSSLTSVTIPESVTSIGNQAFFLCSRLSICGKHGSYAAQYAAENSIPFVAI